MREGDMLEIKVPGSTANLGPGFDSLGLALPLYLTIRLKPANSTEIILKGQNLASLPTDQSNLIYRTMAYLFELEKKVLPSFILEIESEIPLSRGLGSSGAAIVGGLLAANNLLEEPKTKDEIFQIAIKIEGHSDNIGASLYGGFVVTTQIGNNVVAEQLPFPDQLKILVAIPQYTLSTQQAREQIPTHVPLKDAAHNIGQTALFVYYLTTGQIEKVPTVMNDRLHQPYRQKVVKGLERILYYADKNKVGAALSGAGPTLLMLVQDFQVPIMAEYLTQVAQIEHFEIDLKLLSIEKDGPIISKQINKEYLTYIPF